MSALQRFIIFFCILSCGIAWYQGCTFDMNTLYPDAFLCSIDDILSVSMQAELHNFIAQEYGRYKNPYDLIEKIQQAFPVINSVTVSVQDPTQLQVILHAHKPLFIINNDFVVCTPTFFCQKSIFTDTVVAHLEHVVCDEDLTKDQVTSVADFFMALSQAVVQSFSVHWMNRYTIKLYSKLDHDILLLTSYMTIPTVDDIAQCYNIVHQVVQAPKKDRPVQASKHNRQWVCDLRFDKQVILFSINRGR